MFPPEHFGILEGSGASIGGLVTAPGIDLRDSLTLVRGDNYTTRPILFTQQAGEYWSDLTGATVTLTIRINGVSTAIAGTVITATGTEKQVQFAPTSADLAVAGTGVFDVQATIDGSKETLRAGAVTITSDVTP